MENNTALSEFLSITDMARLRNVSTETLRHYDRIGLLKPDYTDENGMRFYSISNYEKLQTIKELKQLGMKLSDIRQYFQNRTFHASCELIEAQNQYLNQKIAELKKIQRQVSQKRKYMHTISEASYCTEPFLKDFPDRYYVSTGQKVLNESDLSYQLMKLENLVYQTEQYSPLYATERYAALLSPTASGSGNPSQTHKRELMIFISPDKKAVSDNCQKIAGGTFCCARGTGDFWAQEKTIQRLLSYLEQEHLAVESPVMIENVIVDHSITDLMEERLYEFQVKIK